MAHPAVRSAVRLVLAAAIGLHVLGRPVVAQQNFIEGVFTQTESGTPIELISWATVLGDGRLKMDRGFLEDAPAIPRTYRFMVNLGTYNVAGVVAVNADIFNKPMDHLEHRSLPCSVVRLGVQTFEVGVPELENWDKVQRMKKSLKATDDKPLIFFLVVTNGASPRYYPFFVNR